MPAAREPTAGVVVVGNEILSGKVVDTNSAFMARELRRLGVALRGVVVVPDDVEEIAAAVSAYHRRFDLVFTSGGVGPTHDDVTIAGVARALGRRVVRHPDTEARLREFYGEKINAARLKMAEIPEGAELITGGNLSFPTIRVENIYVLPGIPEILEEKFRTLAPRFAGAPYHLRVVYSREGEGTIAEMLERTLAAFPGLLVGSYPKVGDPEYLVKVTLESKDREYVERALAYLLEIMPAGSVVRTAEVF